MHSSLKLTYESPVTQLKKTAGIKIGKVCGMSIFVVCASKFVAMPDAKSSRISGLRSLTSESLMHFTVGVSKQVGWLRKELLKAYLPLSCIPDLLRPPKKELVCSLRY